MTQFILMSIIGLIAGVIIRLLRPWTDAMGWLVSFILGIAGAFLGGIVASLFSLSFDGLSLASVIVVALSFFGASVLLIAYEMLADQDEYDYDDDDYDDSYDYDEGEEDWHR